MMWLLLGVGTLVGAGPMAPFTKDSAGVADLRSHLPNDLRVRVEKARQMLQSQHDTLAKLTPTERARRLDSLRREAAGRRTEVLDNASPEERRKLEMRLQELERQLEQKPRTGPVHDPNQGFRQ